MKTKFTSLISLFLLLASCSSGDSDEIVGVPSTTTIEISNIQQTSVTVSGSATDDGGANITDKGIVWGATPKPDLNSNKKSSGPGTGNFSLQVTDLEPNITYYFRSYATNNNGTAYGQELMATTLRAEPQQKVFEGDIGLNTQQEVDDFGAMGYTEITGRLFCGGNQITSSKIQSLQALSSIKKVGSLWISHMDDLENLNGLQNITEVNGVVFIQNNKVLNDLTGLRNLVNIQGFLNIDRNDRLTTLNQFDALETVQHIQIINNVSLKVVDTFNEVSETELVLFNHNEGMEFIGGFAKLQKLNRLIIESNKGAFSVDSFHEVQEMNGVLTVNRNKEMVGFTGFEKLVTSPEAIQFWDNINLVSISGFHSLKEMTWLLINATGVNSIDGFNNLELADEIEFSTNFGTYDLSGFDKLKKLNTLEVEVNQNMSKLSGFPNLTEVGLLSIELNLKLTKIDGLMSLQNSTTTYIASNPLLVDFCGLQNLFVNDIDLEPFIENNAFNPTKQEIAEGSCSQ